MAGKKGFGAKLEYLASTGPDVWVLLANITKMRPFDAKADVIDVTAHDSAGEVREKLAGLKDHGAVQMDLNYDDKAASHAWLMTNLGVAKSFRSTFPGSTPTVGTFSGFVKSVSPEIPHDNKMTCSVAIEINGVVTLT